MAVLNQIQLPDGSQYDLADNVSGYATTTYVDTAIAGVDKTAVGLGNVDNTSDLNKPVSTAQQTALNAKTNLTVVAPSESTTTASQRYDIGDQFFLNGVLYTATAIIANGGTITVGTNCTASDTIVEQIANVSPSADNVSFDNAGTDLVSEDVEDAIKEVNDKTKHGIVELWKNSNISTNFAGQTVNILNYDNTMYDGIVIVPEVVSGELRLGTWYQIDNDVLSISSWSGIMEHSTIGANNSKMYRYARDISISLSGTTLSVTFSDCTNTEQNAIGTAPTVTTNNALMIPVRILGLIHND